MRNRIQTLDASSIQRKQDLDYVKLLMDLQNRLDANTQKLAKALDQNRQLKAIIKRLGGDAELEQPRTRAKKLKLFK